VPYLLYNGLASDRGKRVGNQGEGQGGKRSESKESLSLWDPKPCDLSMSSLNNSEEELGRNEPVIVAIIWEDLWIAVKCQSNMEIAGCLRKI
jgi:hypothetical protein